MRDFHKDFTLSTVYSTALEEIACLPGNSQVHATPLYEVHFYSVEFLLAAILKESLFWSINRIMSLGKTERQSTIRSKKL